MEPDYKQQQRDRRPMQDYDEIEDEENEEMEEEEEIDFNSKADPQMQQAQADDEEGADDIQVDFLFLDPNQSQFFSIKSLVNGILDGVSFRSSDLANIICDQVVVGTMIGVEGDDEKPNEKNVLGFATILNLSAYSKQDVMKEIVQYTIEKSEKHNSDHEAFVHLLKSQTDHIGLLINERMINLSPQLVPTLHAQLCEDVNWVRDQNNEDSAAFNLKYLLVLSKCYKEAKNPTKRVNTGFDNFLYQKFEDYVFLQKAMFKFTYTAKSSKNIAGLSSLETAAEDQICERLVYLISFEDYQASLQTVASQLM